MEQQQRVLVIIVSVSIFVAVVIGGALLLTYPGDEPDMARAQRDDSSGDDFDPIEYLNRQESEEPQLESEAEGGSEDSDDVIIVYGQSERERDTVNGRSTDAQPEDRSDMPEESGRERSADRERREQESAGVREPVAEREPAAEQPAPARTEPQQREASRDRVAARQPEQAVQERRGGERGTNYWIQVISSPNLGLVRDAQDTLEENQLGSRITTTEVEGQNYFRLRVGPYENENEAEKFLGWVKEMEGFGSSYISETYFRM